MILGGLFLEKKTFVICRSSREEKGQGKCLFNASAAASWCDWDVLNSSIISLLNCKPSIMYEG
jgi:hypothetical protein